MISLRPEENLTVKTSARFGRIIETFDGESIFNHVKGNQYSSIKGNHRNSLWGIKSVKTSARFFVGPPRATGTSSLNGKRYS